MSAGSPGRPLMQALLYLRRCFLSPLLALGLCVAVTQLVPYAGGAPPNNACSSATTVPFDSGTLTGTTTQATQDGTSTCDAQAAVDPDVWYRYRSVQSGRLHLDSCPTVYNNLLSAHSGCPGTTSNQLVCA